jgi:quinol monooxygenase YgiN
MANVRVCGEGNHQGNSAAHLSVRSAGENQRDDKEEVVEQYVFVRLHARMGDESAVESALREVQGPSLEETGCLSFHLFRSMRDQGLFFIYSRWTDNAAFQKHAELTHTLRFLKRVDALLDQPREVSRTEMIG